MIYFRLVLSDEKENKAEKMDIAPAADEKKGNGRFIRIYSLLNQIRCKKWNFKLHPSCRPKRRKGVW